MTSIGFPPALVGLFILLAAGSLWLDLALHKNGQAVSLESATSWSIFYVLVALVFAGTLAVAYGTAPASLFLSGYVMEKVLSVDNLAVFVAVFSYFKIRPEYQHKVLHWGIIGAFTFRLIFVAMGVGSLTFFGPVAEGVFAVVVAFSAWSMWRELDSTEEDDIDFNNAWYIKAVKKVWPICTSGLFADRFFVKTPAYKDDELTWHITPLFLCLITIEAMDVLFSFDSVPTVIAVTQDPFLVYSAMVFAILGLRSLYFVLSALMNKLEYLPHAIIAVLVFIAVKLGLHATTGFEFGPGVSLLVVGVLLTLGIVYSWANGFKGSIDNDVHP